jgi:hypothetical protein
MADPYPSRTIETTVLVPYHPGFLLGASVNSKTLKTGPTLIGEQVHPAKLPINETTCTFSFVRSVEDVCDALSCRPEYALKVKTGIVDNEMVNQCLKDLGKPDSFIIIFRATFLQQSQCLHPDCVHVNPHSYFGTHWIKDLEIGNELVAKMTLSCADEEKLRELRLKFQKPLISSHGQLDRTKLKELHEVAVKIDNKLSKKHNQDVIFDIWYGSLPKLDKCPASLAGMVKTIDTFMDQCAGWAKRSKEGAECVVEACIMICKLGTNTEGKASVNHPPIQRPPSSPHTAGRPPVKEKPQLLAKGNAGVDVPRFYILRVGLQPYFEGTPLTSRLANLSSTGNRWFEGLFQLIVSCQEAELLIQNLPCKKHLLEARKKKYSQVQNSLRIVHSDVLKTVTDLDFVLTPPASTIKSLVNSNPLCEVEVFVGNVTNKLPPGRDVDVIMLGKTGHGKSATGNSILGRREFETSAQADSQTTYSVVGWIEVDRRKIKVVDTPGMCDTKLNGDDDFIKFGIKSVSSAIINCPEGCHALILVIRYGVKITAEERKAISLLKRCLGENVVKTHGICVITHGDVLQNEMRKRNIDFETWCKESKNAFLKELFEECNYRCVLFDNETEDPKVRKAQLIELVSKVDEVQVTTGTRYTNDLFNYASANREWVMRKENVPHKNEEVVREITLILEHMKNMQTSSSDYNDELSNLKFKLDNVKNLVSGQEKWQTDMLDTIVTLTSRLQAKMEENVHHPESEIKNSTEDVSETEMTFATQESRYHNQSFKIYQKQLEMHLKIPQQIENMVSSKVAETLEPKIEKEKLCFPGSSVVTLSSGRSVPLEDLQVGDKVLVRDSTGHLSFDTVYMFGHKEYETFNEFIAMKAGSYTVYVTGEHYVFCVKHEKEVCVAAKDVQVGDYLLVVTSEGCLTPQSVEAVMFERKRGLFAPFTNSGSIVVDGVLMSCYIDVLTHSACHTLLWPVRQLYRISPSLISYINGSSLQYPVPRWTKAVLKLI